MPALDPIAHAPMKDGPTNLMTGMHALPRSEPFQLRATKAPPLYMPNKPRPLTTRVSHQLSAAPATVLTRTSNINPDAAGQEAKTSIWGISKGMGAEDEASGGGVARYALPVVAGVVLGWLFARR